MNNYLFANLATGKISGKRGGGTPVFTLGEENPTQIYFLDYPKPSSYTPTSYPPLGDAFAFSVNTINQTNIPLNIRCGQAIESAIIQQSSWSDLPSTVAGVYTVSYESPDNDSFIGSSLDISISGELSLNPTPTSGVFRIRVPYRQRTGTTSSESAFEVPTSNSGTLFSKWVYIPYYASDLDIMQAIISVYSGLINLNSGLEELPIITAKDFPYQQTELIIGQQRYNKEIEKYNLEKNSDANKIIVAQSGDFTFSYSASGIRVVKTETNSFEWVSNSNEPDKKTLVNTTKTTEIFFTGTPNVQIETLNLAAPYGKYGNLNFNNPAWETFLGSENEKEIWIDAALGTSPKVVAQGRAILRKKLSV
jgi:hypothetical protein